MTTAPLEQSPFIVRGPLLSAFRDADTVRAEAHREAAAILKKAEAEAEQLRHQAVMRGAEQAAALLGKATEAARLYQASQENALVELAFAIAARMVGDMPRDARIMALVKTALTEHSDWSRLRLRAHSSVVPVLRAILADSGADIRTDDALGVDECVLLHPDGRTDLGPVQQIRAMMAANSTAEVRE